MSLSVGDASSIMLANIPANTEIQVANREETEIANIG